MANGSTNGRNGKPGRNGNGQAKATTIELYPPGHDKEGKIPDLEQAIRQAFFDVVAQTGNIRLACRAVGIHHSTYYRWKGEGERLGRGKYYSFWQAAERGMAEWERRQVETIRKAAQEFLSDENWDETWTKPDGKTSKKKVKKKRRRRGDWRAAAFLLERKFPERYGPRQKVEIEGRLDMVDILTDLRDEEEKRRAGESAEALAKGVEARNNSAR